MTARELAAGREAWVKSSPVMSQAMGPARSNVKKLSNKSQILLS